MRPEMHRHEDCANALSDYSYGESQIKQTSLRRQPMIMGDADTANPSVFAVTKIERWFESL